VRFIGECLEAIFGWGLLGAYNIYAYILTVKKNGMNIMQTLLDAMHGKPFMPLVCKTPAF